MQTDGGTEFKPLKDYFQKRGIQHRITCPHTSEQNGLVERKHRHIVETGLTLLAQASLPMKFWPDSFDTVVYLINKLNTRILNFKSPAEILFNTKVHYNSLRTFGCLCFHCLRSYNNHKLNFRSLPCTFIGYASNQKGYKCLKSDGRIIISRHVVFNEKVFPFKTNIKTTS